jgi:hypothetical protein
LPMMLYTTDSNNEETYFQLFFRFGKTWCFNISVISWRSVILVEETRVPGEKQRPISSHCQTLSHNIVSSIPWHERGSNSQEYILPIYVCCVMHGCIGAVVVMIVW